VALERERAGKARHSEIMPMESVLMTDEDKLRSLVLDVLRRIAPEADLQALDPGRSFRDQFGIDSIDYLNLIMALEEKLALRIADLDYPKLSSLDGCLAYLKSRARVAEHPMHE
jgi:acyl carrier protein